MMFQRISIGLFSKYIKKYHERICRMHIIICHLGYLSIPVSGSYLASSGAFVFCSLGLGVSLFWNHIG